MISLATTRNTQAPNLKAAKSSQSRTKSTKIGLSLARMIRGFDPSHRHLRTTERRTNEAYLHVWQRFDQVRFASILSIWFFCLFVLHSTCSHINESRKLGSGFAVSCVKKKILHRHNALAVSAIGLMESKGEHKNGEQAEKKPAEQLDLATISWRFEAWLNVFPLHRRSLLDYFKHSPFYGTPAFSVARWSRRSDAAQIARATTRSFCSRTRTSRSCAT